MYVSPSFLGSSGSASSLLALGESTASNAIQFSDAIEFLSFACGGIDSVTPHGVRLFRSYHPALLPITTHGKKLIDTLVKGYCTQITWAQDGLLG